MHNISATRMNICNVAYKKTYEINSLSVTIVLSQKIKCLKC